jgi:excisionase family DNA binding protein
MRLRGQPELIPTRPDFRSFRKPSCRTTVTFRALHQKNPHLIWPYSHRSLMDDTVSFIERLTMSELIKPLLVDIPTAARMLAVSRDHVYRLIRNRELRSVEMGNGRAKTRIRVADLEALITSRTFA